MFAWIKGMLYYRRYGAGARSLGHIFWLQDQGELMRSDRW